MRQDQQEILEEIKKTFEMKSATEKVADEIQEKIAHQCRQAHSLGLSDRQISESINRRLSRTRIQQLRTNDG